MKRRVLIVVILIVAVVAVVVTWLGRIVPSRAADLVENIIGDNESVDSISIGSISYRYNSLSSVELSVDSVYSRVINRSYREAENSIDLNRVKSDTITLFSPKVVVDIDLYTLLGISKSSEDSTEEVDLYVDSVEAEFRGDLLSIKEGINIYFRGGKYRVSEEDVDISFLSTNLNSLVEAVVDIDYLSDSLEFSASEITYKDGYGSLEGSLLESKFRVAGDLKNTPLDILSIFVSSSQVASTQVSKSPSIIDRMEGEFSLDFNFNGDVDERGELIDNSLFGELSVNTSSIYIEGNLLEGDIADIISRELTTDATVDPIEASWRLKRGIFELKEPIDISMADQTGSISGWHSIDGYIDYKMPISLTKEAIGPDVKRYIDMIPGAGDLKYYDIVLLAKGDIDSIKVNTDFNKVAEDVAKEMLKGDNLEKTIQKFGFELLKLFQ